MDTTGNLDNSPSVQDSELATLRERVANLYRLASIGQLTAGLLHEIKNPLSFITSYARLSTGLVEELERLTARRQPQPDPDELTDVVGLLKNNVLRIQENGARAERIIKGTLAQTHSETAHFEATDLNTLLEEFTKLAYQGMRAGDSAFVAALSFQLDPSIRTVPMAPYEFNRVVINLVLNACYAVNERRKREPESYKPTILVSSEKLAGQLIIRIRDNGDGISDAIRSKLFTPFFTTKPVGVGTGLGLSLSRDIITNLHNGTLDVDSEPGHYTEFIIRLPLETGQ